MASLHEFCLDEGITELSGVMETWWLPRLQQLEFTVHALGLPALVENQMTMAARFVISARPSSTSSRWPTSKARYWSAADRSIRSLIAP